MFRTTAKNLAINCPPTYIYSVVDKPFLLKTQTMKKSEPEVKTGRSDKSGETEALQDADQNKLLVEEKSDQFESTLPESLITDDKELVASTETEGSGEQVEAAGITKQSLNFRQIKLSTEEQTKVTELKNRLRTINAEKTD